MRTRRCGGCGSTSRDMEALSCHACGGTFAGAAARAWSRVGLVVTVAATMGLACLAVMWRLHGGGH